MTIIPKMGDNGRIRNLFIISFTLMPVNLFGKCSLFNTKNAGLRGFFVPKYSIVSKLSIVYIIVRRIIFVN